MVSFIWFILIVVGISYSLFNGTNITNVILSTPKEAIDLCLQIFPNIALWFGIMKILENSGLIDKLSKITSKLIKPLFKDIPENDKALGYISSNIIVNMFGVGNAATPIGLKAMKSLQELNKSDRASKAMITFLVINTSGLTLLPTSVLGLRTFYNSSDPGKIIVPAIIVTFLSTIVSLIIDYIFRRIYHD